MANSWVLLKDASTLASIGSNSNDSLDTGTFAAKNHLFVRYFTSKTGGNLDCNIRFNGVSSAQYSERGRRFIANSQSDDVNVDSSGIFMNVSSATRHSGIMTIENRVGSPKLVFTRMVDIGTYPPHRTESVAKRLPTSLDTQITSIQIHNSGSGSFDNPVEIQVWGTDTFTTSDAKAVNGTIFEESDTGKIYMFDGASAWNEVT